MSSFIGLLRSAAAAARNAAAEAADAAAAALAAARPPAEEGIWVARALLPPLDMSGEVGSEGRLRLPSRSCGGSGGFTGEFAAAALAAREMMAGVGGSMRVNLP
jgi:hypothetical protein